MNQNWNNCFIVYFAFVVQLFSSPSYSYFLVLVLSFPPSSQSKWFVGVSLFFALCFLNSNTLSIFIYLSLYSDSSHSHSQTEICVIAAFFCYTMVLYIGFVFVLFHHLSSALVRAVYLSIILFTALFNDVNRFNEWHVKRNR